jgi:hypothetical protein
MLPFWTPFKTLLTRVARWLFFKQKIPIWVNFAVKNLGIFYDHFVYFTANGNILWPFETFCGNLVYVIFLVLVFWNKKNRATLLLTLPDRPPQVLGDGQRSIKVLVHFTSNTKKVFVSHACKVIVTNRN